MGRKKSNDHEETIDDGSILPSDDDRDSDVHAPQNAMAIAQGDVPAVEDSDVIQSAEALFSVALAYEDAVVVLGTPSPEVAIVSGGTGYRWIYPEELGRRYAAQRGWSEPIDFHRVLGLDD